MSVAHISHEVGFLDAIKEKPHWHIVFHPQLFEEKRIESLDEIWRLVETCRVSLRERDYPHIYEARDKSKDWIASWGHSKWQCGYWRFFQSAQFIHRLSLFEDGIVDRGLYPKPHVDPLEVLYTVTEIFEFSARLASRGIFGSALSITIEVLGIQNRMLSTTALPQFFVFEERGPVTEAALKHCWTGPVTEFEGGSAELAVDFVARFFEAFGYQASRQMLTERQHRFLQRM
jgi:hypothetical protein